MIVANVRETRLQNPIAVVPRKRHDEGQFDIVRGYGRFEAFIALGETTILAAIIEISPENMAQCAHVETSCEGTTH